MLCMTTQHPASSDRACGPDQFALLSKLYASLNQRLFQLIERLKEFVGHGLTCNGH
jgi:hypothetical protein